MIALTAFLEKHRWKIVIVLVAAAAALWLFLPLVAVPMILGGAEPSAGWDSSEDAVIRVGVYLFWILAAAALVLVIVPLGGSARWRDFTRHSGSGLSFAVGAVILLLLAFMLGKIGSRGTAILSAAAGGVSGLVGFVRASRHLTLASTPPNERHVARVSLVVSIVSMVALTLASALLLLIWLLVHLFGRNFNVM